MEKSITQSRAGDLHRIECKGKRRGIALPLCLCRQSLRRLEVWLPCPSYHTTTLPSYSLGYLGRQNVETHKSLLPIKVPEGPYQSTSGPLLATSHPRAKTIQMRNISRCLRNLSSRRKTPERQRCEDCAEASGLPWSPSP